MKLTSYLDSLGVVAHLPRDTSAPMTRAVKVLSRFTQERLRFAGVEQAARARRAHSTSIAARLAATRGPA